MHAPAAAQSEWAVSALESESDSGRRHVVSVDGSAGPSTPAERRASLLDLAYAAPRLTASELHVLPPLSAGERASLRSRLTAGDRLQVGVARPFAVPVGFDMSARKTLPVAGERVGGGLLEQKSGQLVWTAGFSSPGAGALRIRMERMWLPVGTVAYAYNRKGEVHGPYVLGGYQPEPIWSNTLFSDEVFLEIRFPRGFVDLSTARLNVSVLAHLEHESFAPGAPSPEVLADCFRDVSCVGEDDLAGLSNAKRAAAQLLFERDGGMYVCSGALVTTTAGNAIPYLLTANHCVSSAASASSL
jgi:hypothetical protein